MSNLDDPIRLPCGRTLPSRIAMAPLTNTQSHEDGTLSEIEQRWLERRARGGFGLISTCAAYVSEEGKAWPGQLGVADHRHLAGLTRLAEGLHGHGAACVVQLHHGGAKAELAPGLRLTTADDPEGGLRGATLTDLDRVVNDFVAAAVRAEKAGFDGVEIHGANGYLFTQFLAPLDNPRTDAFGGDLEGRARLLRQTMRAVRAAVSPGFAVGVRLSPVDVWAQRGLVVEDSAIVARWLAEDGADFIHLSLSDAASRPPGQPEAPPVATTIRAAVPAEVPVLAAGGIATRADAEAAVAAGVDVVVIGRACIPQPDWPVASRAAEFVPVPTPWSPELLRAADVGEPLLTYLRRFPGMVVGGAPPRR